jgi:pilus assembly protein CpaC
MHAHTILSIPRRGWAILGLLAAVALAGLHVQAQPSGSRESYDIGIGQKLTLRSANGKDIKSVVVSRGDIIDVAQVAPDQPTVVQITGKALGSARVTLVTEPPEDERNTVIVNVIPDLSHIQAIVDRQFPMARVTLALSGTGAILASGHMDVAEDVAALISFLQGYGFRVVNNIKVGGVQQVQLEVCVATVDRSELRQLGFNFFQNVNGQYLGSTIGPVVQQPILFEPASPPTSPIPAIFSTGGQPIGRFDPNLGNLFFGVTTRNSGIHTFLQALRQESLVKDIANPNLVTLSGRPATFLVGGDAPYGTAGAAGISGGGGSGIQFRPFGTRLTFLPIVLGDGRIRLEIEAEVSTIANANVAGIGNPNIVAPSFATNRIHTTVEMGNGETFALGGLLENQVVANTSKVPVLGDLPFIGSAWRTVSYREREIEVLVIVTPRLVDPMDCTQRTTKLPGQETRTPTDFELFLEGILEAPRGPRELCPDGCYRPAHWWTGPFCDPLRGCSSGVGHGIEPAGCSGCGSATPGVSEAVPNSRPAMPPMAPSVRGAEGTVPASAGSVTRVHMLLPEPEKIDGKFEIPLRPAKGEDKANPSESGATAGTPARIDP